MKTSLRARSRTTPSAGFTMLEIIVILAVIMILAATLTPLILNYLDDAKQAKAERDVKEIGGALLTLTKDTGHLPIYKDGTKMTGEGDIHLLRGPGNNPVDFTPSQGQGNATGQKWLETTKIGELENHVFKNNPGTAPYPASGRNRWRGPYLERLSTDPWGNRYLVNVRMASPEAEDEAPTWVLSAGPNGKIETPSNGAAGSAPGGDDIVYRVK